MINLCFLCPVDCILGSLSVSGLLPWQYPLAGALCVGLSEFDSVLPCFGFRHLSSSLLQFLLFHRTHRFQMMYLRSCWILLLLSIVISGAVFIYLLGLHFAVFPFSIVMVYRWSFRLLHWSGVILLCTWCPSFFWFVLCSLWWFCLVLLYGFCPFLVKQLGILSSTVPGGRCRIAAFMFGIVIFYSVSLLGRPLPANKSCMFRWCVIVFPLLRIHGS